MPVMAGESSPARLGASPLPGMPGIYVRLRPRGFVAHICASSRALRTVRALTASVLPGHGVAAETAETAQLVVSELVGNSVRACGEHVPLVVEVYAVCGDVAVKVHDPDPTTLPRRGRTALDSTEAESGRGLGMLDLLAPGWRVGRSAIGKQVRCRVPGARPGG